MEMKTLSNGVKIPCIAYGTGVINFPSRKINTDTLVHDIREIRLLSQLSRCGISLIDTSESYGKSHIHLRRVLNESRKDYFICTKISNQAQYSNQVKESFEIMLKELGTDYIDLLLLHWPVPEIYLKSWKILEELYLSDRCSAIGVANFNIHHLEKLRNNCDIMPMVNQFECHPLFSQSELRDYCNNRDIQVMAYTSTARMDQRLNITSIKEISNKHKKSMAQVILRWHIQLGNIPIINTSRYSHLLDNANIFDFILSDKEMKSINEININSRLRYDPDNCNFSKL